MKTHSGGCSIPVVKMMMMMMISQYMFLNLQSVSQLMLTV